MLVRPLLLAGLTISAALAQTSQDEVHSPKFSAGQLWSVKSTQPTSAKVIVGRVDQLKGTTTVHVSVIDVPIPAGAANAGRIIQIGHMPFDGEALSESVDKLLATGVAPGAEFDAGYAQWKEARGGVFRISVSKAVAEVFGVLK